MRVVGRLRDVLVTVVALGVLCVACSSTPPFHASIKPDTPHNNLAAYRRFVQAEYRPSEAQMIPAQLAEILKSESVLFKETRCDEASLRSHFSQLDRNSDSDTLYDTLPRIFFKCGRSAVVRVLNTIHTIDSADAEKTRRELAPDGF